MCFNKSKSSSKQESNVSNRDERMAADNFARVFSLKDIGTGSGNNQRTNVTLTANDLSLDAMMASYAVVDKAVAGSAALAKDVTKEGFDLAAAFGDAVFTFAGDVLGFAAAADQRSDQFAMATQVAFADTVRSEMTNDITEVVNKAITAAAVIAGIYFIVQVMK